MDAGIEVGGPVAVERPDERDLGIADRRQGIQVLAAEAPLGHVPFVVDVGEERAQRVEVFGGVGVVFVVMALGAAHRRSHPHARHVADPVGLVDGPVFLDLQAALVRRLQKPVVGARQHRVFRMLARSRAHEVAGELHDREPIERHVVEKRFDHPVAVRRDVVGLIAVIADGVGVAHQVEPPGCHPLGMARRGE